MRTFGTIGRTEGCLFKVVPPTFVLVAFPELGWRNVLQSLQIQVGPLNIGSAAEAEALQQHVE